MEDPKGGLNGSGGGRSAAGRRAVGNQITVGHDAILALGAQSVKQLTDGNSTPPTAKALSMREDPTRAGWADRTNVSSNRGRLAYGRELAFGAEN